MASTVVADRTITGDYISKYTLEAVDGYPMKPVIHTCDGLHFLA